MSHVREKGDIIILNLWLLQYLENLEFPSTSEPCFVLHDCCWCLSTVLRKVIIHVDYAITCEPSNMTCCMNMLTNEHLKNLEFFSSSEPGFYFDECCGCLSTILQKAILQVNYAVTHEPNNVTCCIMHEYV